MPNINNSITRSITVSNNVPSAGASSGGGGGGFSPLDLSPIIWTDASDASSIADTGGLVDTWSDLSGNTNHLTGTTTTRPVTGTRTMNSLNAIDFDGLTQFLAIPAQTLTDFNITLVIRVDALATTSMILGSGSSNNYLFTSATTGVLKMRIAAAISTTVEALAVDTDTRINMARTGSSLDITVNGVTEAFTNSGNFEVTLLMKYLSELPVDGLIGETVFYDKVLTSGEQASLATYINDKWGTL